jgi:hypothetical protein
MLRSTAKPLVCEHFVEEFSHCDSLLSGAPSCWNHNPAMQRRFWQRTWRLIILEDGGAHPDTLEYLASSSGRLSQYTRVVQILTSNSIFLISIGGNGTFGTFCTRAHSLCRLNKFNFISWVNYELADLRYRLFLEETWVPSPSWTDYKHQLQKLILLAGSRGCKAWTTVSLFGRIFFTFFFKAANDFEMHVCCAKHSMWFAFVFFFRLVFFSTRTSLFNSFLFRSDPVVDTTLKKMYGWIPCLELWSREIWDKIFPYDFKWNLISHIIGTKKKKLNIITYHNHSHTRKEFRYLTRSWAQLHCSVNYFSGSCCRRLAMSHAVPVGCRQITS